MTITTVTARRSPARIMYSTWKALFLRSAVARLSKRRLAWFWLIFDPLFSIVLLMLVFSFLRVRHIQGIETAVWVMAGVLAFMMFRSTAGQATGAVGISRRLFSYPQIRPFDPVVTAAALEGFLVVLVSIVLLAGATVIEFDVVPRDPLAVLEALFGMWLTGLGYGLVNSVMTDISRVASWFLSFLLRPLYMLSGVIFPIMLIPYPYRDWVFYNPLVHGLESMRLGFAPYYHISSEINLGYLYGWALGLVFLGLALHKRYRSRLMVSQRKK
jgi:capsular polysaccharide transport system permease protein